MEITLGQYISSYTFRQLAWQMSGDTQKALHNMKSNRIDENTPSYSIIRYQVNQSDVSAVADKLWVK